LTVHLASIVISLPIAMIALAFCVVGLPMMLLWVGLPMVLLALLISHGYARLKKSLAVWQGSEDWVDLPPVPRPAKIGRMRALFLTAQRWREFAYTAIGGLADWVIALLSVTLLAVGVAEILAPFFATTNGILESLVSEGVILSRLPRWLDLPIGVALLALAVPLVLVASQIQIGLTRAFLAPSRQAMAARLERVEQARAAGAQAESTHLSRIERDLHDGPQQRLIRTGMDLASLDRRLTEGDTVGARELLDQVRTRNDETLTEIRFLSRGFAPPILAERGLKQAVASLAATSPIPTSVAIDLGANRPPEPVERAVYFAISESLANAAKHSGAHAIQINIQQTPDGLVAEVIDDGRGGAIPLPGHGLAGLSDRLRAVGGQIVVTSPAGQGTTVSISVSYH
jgi:signal transduction histidine kinase